MVTVAEDRAMMLDRLKKELGEDAPFVKALARQIDKGRSEKDLKSNQFHLGLRQTEGLPELPEENEGE